MKKKLIAILAAAIMVFAFVGCGSSQEEATEETAAETTAETTVAEETTAEATEAASDDIGLERATKIALDDAGLKEKDVQFTKQKTDIDDGMTLYEIEFISGEQKFEYDIDAQTGKIFDRDIDSIYDD